MFGRGFNVFLVVVGVAFALVLGWVFVAPVLGGGSFDPGDSVRVAKWTAEEREAARRTADKRARERQRKRLLAEAAEKRERERREAEAKDKAEQRKAEAEQRIIDKYRAMGPAGRAAELPKLCPTNTDKRCDWEPLRLLLESTASPAEHSRLARAVRKARETRKRKSSIKLRESFARTYETALLNAQRNPRGVKTVGRDKTTLHVSGWFCSRQFLYNFQTSADGELARTAGFKKLTCSSGLVSWSVDL